MGLNSVQGAGRRQLVGTVLIGWWGGKWESALSAFWFQLVWGLRASGQHAVTFLPPAGGFSLCKTAPRTWLRTVSTALEEELKVLDFV